MKECRRSIACVFLIKFGDFVAFLYFVFFEPALIHFKSVFRCSFAAVNIFCQGCIFSILIIVPLLSIKATESGM